jgi:hypothetical protein
MGEGSTELHALEALIGEAKASGGSELSNCGIFIERLCLALGLPGPDMAKEANELNDYVLERRATLTAYGWEDLIPALIGKPGATLPSPHKSEAQEQAVEEPLSRLVGLNQERAAEEKRGIVRWLRSDYQIPKLGPKAPKPAEEHVGVLDIELPDADGRPKWPSDGLEQIRLVRDLLAKAPAPAPPDAIAMAFDGRSTAKRRDRINEVLQTLVETGLARTGEVESRTRYFLPR